MRRDLTAGWYSLGLRRSALAERALERALSSTPPRYAPGDERLELDRPK